MKFNKVIILVLVLSVIGCQSNKEQSKNRSATNIQVSEMSSKPNVIFIYADDMGYGDAGCFGSDRIATPGLDKMAENGARLTNFYSCSAVCTPSRAGLLTGRNPIRSGLTRVLFPNSLEGIDKSEYTMATLFKEAGYTTGMVGKWHLGCLPGMMPTDHGFDSFFGLPYSNDMEWEPRHDPPTPLYKNKKIMDQPVYQKTLTQRYTAEAKNFILSNQDKPFFLYFPHTFPHKPWNVSKAFEGTSKFGLYGDVMQELDHSVKEIMEVLEKTGLDNNTIVVFSSDNGSTPDCGKHSTGGLRGYKRSVFEGGVRVPTLIQWKGKIKNNIVIDKPAVMTDWMATFAKIIGTRLPDDRYYDSYDLSNMLFKEGSRASEDIYFYWQETLTAMRSGQWKYFPNYTDPYEQDYEFGEMLFDLEKDPQERNNLAKQLPELTKELKTKMVDYEAALGEVPAPKIKAKPFDDPRKNKKRKKKLSPIERYEEL